MTFDFIDLNKIRISRKIVAKWRMKKLLNSSSSFSKTSATYSQIIEDLDEGIRDRSDDVRMTMIESDEENNQWGFESSTGHKVEIQADPRVKDLEKADLLTTCSCPFWQYSGPEYHAKKENYLKGNPRGTATEPDIKDPDRDHYICKHVLKALNSMF